MFGTAFFACMSFKASLHCSMNGRVRDLPEDLPETALKEVFWEVAKRQHHFPLARMVLA